jgi:hypothetical protein
MLYGWGMQWICSACDYHVLFCFLGKALSALSSQAANLSSKLEAALKQQEQFFKTTLKQHSAKVSKVHHLL